nr:histidinol-phosphate transaminase [Candidatus Bathyarchaeota archaeon]
MKNVRRILMNLKPYRGETSRVELARLLGVPPDYILPLHANENLFIDEEWVKENIVEALKRIDPRMYPDPQNVEVCEVLAQHYGVHKEEVVIGNGADELIDGISRCFIENGDTVVTLDPTFQVYELSATLYGGVHKSVLLRGDFSIDTEHLLNVVGDAKLIYICSPNNPTGNQHEESVIREVLENTNSIIVLDEAYVEFADKSLSGLIHEYENLIVLRTFSKAFGIAGLRFGVALSNPESADFMRRVLQPYNVNSIAQYTVLSLLDNWEYVAGKIEEVKREREKLRRDLSRIEGIRVYPSKANFLLVRVIREDIDATTVQGKLMEKGILVRDRSNLPLLGNCLRITVCPKPMSERLILALKEVLSGENEL